MGVINPLPGTEERTLHSVLDLGRVFFFQKGRQTPFVSDVFWRIKIYESENAIRTKVEKTNAEKLLSGIKLAGERGEGGPDDMTSFSARDGVSAPEAAHGRVRSTQVWRPDRVSRGDSDRKEHLQDGL